VLVLTPDFPPATGGIQTLVERTASAFERFTPSVVTIDARGSREVDEARPYRILRTPAGANHGLEVAALNAAGLVEGLRRRPAVILSAHVVTGPAAISLGRILRRPVVQYVHAKELLRHQMFVRTILRAADAVVAVSSYSQGLVEQVAGRRCTIRVVHPGVDSPPDPPAPAMSRPSVAVVSRLADRYKGHDVLLRAFALVLKRVPDAELHIVGDGPLRPDLERLAAAVGVNGATTFHGRLSDGERDALLRASSVFAMPSRTEANGAGEGFGIAYVEAGAFGLPVVAGNAGGAVDAVVDGQTGLLVDPTDPTAVASALSALLDDTGRARLMGHAGWERSRSLSWAAAAAKVETVMAEAMSA
jgi:phosphatidylinositol alpha-1,6-mannosyltransferase